MMLLFRIGPPSFTVGRIAQTFKYFPQEYYGVIAPAAAAADNADLHDTRQVIYY